MGKKAIVTVTNDLIQDQRMHRICASLTKEGIDVTLVGRIKRNSLDLPQKEYRQIRLKCFFEKGIGFYLEYTIRLFFFLLRHPYDVLYTVDLDTLLAGGKANWLKRRPHIHDAHEYFVEVPELQGKTIKKWLWNTVGRVFYPRCDLRMTVNKELAKELSTKYKCEFAIVRSTPILVDSKPKHKLSKVILYQGVLNEGRGLESAIRAVSQSNIEMELHIAGEGDLSQPLRNLKAKIDVHNKVKFLGWKRPDELKEITNNAHIGLNLLSASSLNYKYSLANKFFDYMHAGVPSVNMSFPVYKRIIAEYEVGICIDGLEEDKILEAIRELSNKETYSRMVGNCTIARQQFNWQNEEQVLLALIDKMM